MTTTKTLLSLTRALTRSTILLVGGGLLGGALVACEPTEPLARGRELYDSCLPCHNADGGGNQSILAPSIAGLPEWYIESQLMKFRAAKRGYHFDDTAGLRMRPMALSMPTEQDVKAVSTYVASLPRPSHTPMIQGGDVNRGKALYSTCTACHGADGVGNLALNAPALVGADDWYLVEQLKKFKGKLRGDPAVDPVGATMQAMTATLPDEQAMKDVVAYIMTLPVPASLQPAPAPAAPGGTPGAAPATPHATQQEH